MFYPTCGLALCQKHCYSKVKMGWCPILSEGWQQGRMSLNCDNSPTASACLGTPHQKLCLLSVKMSCIMENAQTVFIVVSEWGILHQRHDSCYHTGLHFVSISIQIKCAFFTDNRVHVKCLLVSCLMTKFLTEGQCFYFVLFWKGLHWLNLVRFEISCLMEDCLNDASWSSQLRADSRVWLFELWLKSAVKWPSVCLWPASALTLAEAAFLHRVVLPVSLCVVSFWSWESAISCGHRLWFVTPKNAFKFLSLQYSFTLRAITLLQWPGSEAPYMALNLKCLYMSEFISLF